MAWKLGHHIKFAVKTFLFLKSTEIYFWKILSESGRFTSKGLHGCTYPPETKLTRAYNWIIDVSIHTEYVITSIGTWFFQLKNRKRFAMHFGVLNMNLLDWFQSQVNYLVFKVHMCFISSSVWCLLVQLKSRYDSQLRPTLHLEAIYYASSRLFDLLLHSQQRSTHHDTIPWLITGPSSNSYVATS